MTSDIPPWLNINVWQWSVHRVEQRISWTAVMDHQVRRYMRGEIVVSTAANNCGTTLKRVEGRAQALMIAALAR